MAKVPGLQLDAEDILDAAIEILREQGLDAVSMRSVATRLGVSPVPLYSRVGNKDALLDAVAERLLHDLAPPASADEPWATYAERWARELRSRLRQAPDARLILGVRRWAYVEASRPLIGVMRSAGFAPDAAVRSCRLLMWATVGFVAMEGGPTLLASDTGRRRMAGGDPSGVTQEDVEELFETHTRYVVEGIARDVGS
jgi:TetR/AcrR family transcriptional regulator, tetracycline repressor protein